MSKRRKRKSDADVVFVFVGLGILLALTFQKQLEIILKVGLWLVLVVGIVAGIVIYRRRTAERSSLRSYSGNAVQQFHVSSGGSDVLGEEFNRRLNKPASPNNLKPDQWSLELIKSLDWKRVEELFASYFVAKGHRAKVTVLGADGGIDILLYGHNDPDKVLGVVQCKAWSQKLVGVKDIRELLGVMTDIGCPLGVYLTTSGYTSDAQAFAKNKHIKLMRAEELLKLILQLPADAQKNLLDEATAGDYRTPSCPNCGIKLVTRTISRGSRSGRTFWGCPNYPRCRYTMNARSV